MVGGCGPSGPPGYTPEAERMIILLRELTWLSGNFFEFHLQRLAPRTSTSCYAKHLFVFLYFLLVL